MPNQLLAIRKAQGIAQRALAVKVGCDKGTLSDIENYDARPGPSVRQRIADALGVPVSDVWPDNDQSFPTTNGVTCNE